jgi:hypothetical protein
MKKYVLILAVVALAGIVFADTFDDVASARFWGKTSIPRLTRTIDANFSVAESRIAALEGSVPTNAVAGLTGVLKADDGVVSAAVAGTDYLAPDGDGSALSGVVTTEADPIVAAIEGIVKSDGTTIAAAVAGTDYLAPGVTFTNSVAATITNLVIVVENGLVTSVTINDQELPSED